MEFFFEEAPLSNSGQGEGVNFLEDGQIIFQASNIFQGPGPEQRKVHGCSTRSDLQCMFHPKVSRSSFKPVKYRYPTSKRERNLSKSKVVFEQFRPLLLQRPLITILHRKLPKSYKGALGTCGYFRVTNSLYNHTTPRFNSFSLRVCGRQNFDRQRTRRANSNAGRQPGFRTRLQHRICQQSVCAPHKERRTKICHQPLPIKLI